MIFSDFTDVFALAIAFNLAIAAKGGDLSKILRQMADELTDEYKERINEFISTYNNHEKDIESKFDKLKQKRDSYKKSLDFKAFFNDTPLPCICLFLGLFGTAELVVDGFNNAIFSNFLLYWNASCVVMIIFLAYQFENLRSAFYALLCSFLIGIASHFIIYLSVMITDDYLVLYEMTYDSLKWTVLIPYVGVVWLFPLFKKYRRTVKIKMRELIEEWVGLQETIKDLTSSNNNMADAIIKNMIND